MITKKDVSIIHTLSLYPYQVAELVKALDECIKVFCDDTEVSDEEIQSMIRLQESLRRLKH